MKYLATSPRTAHPIILVTPFRNSLMIVLKWLKQVSIFILLAPIRNMRMRIFTFGVVKIFV